ncbi:hypothetical protein C8A05DRAFT_38886 [Staphylotrichum tortipilum]|uniref:BZIP transcription factor n=1 Tax=Staphylotrichum tortipilum TaxID=2831512 RepID=A0AAN6RPM9_9PEZI|nr:hypothetical protein C8A05DRAFT_38886 [Staphylotrichum longicolle]
MSTPSTPPAKRKRVRTASQLEQKRLADRIKHRENRHENKNRLDKMESDIAEIKFTLQALVTHLQARVPKPKLLNCQCGSQHLDRFDCVDQCNITTFYQHQIATFPTTITRSLTPGILPRNPSLPSMMLHTMDENIATFLITGFLRQYRNKGIEQLLSFYLLGYRYMRWQMSPCEETIRDVPVWMLPTDIQRSNPHSVIVDYIPWPRLRDHLCTSGDEDLARSVYFYFESTEFVWPAERPVFAQSEGGQMAPSLEFERAVGKLEHWRLGAPWSDAFPHLLHLVEP